MKIAITADPFIPVPPENYGGIERIIFSLIEQYTALGHEVTLFAHKDSNVPCKLIPYPSDSNNLFSIVTNAWIIFKEVFFKRYDVVHSFGRLAYLTPLLPWGIKKIMSYQREPSLKQIHTAMRFAKKHSLVFTGCSRYIADQIRTVAPGSCIYNFVDINKYTFTAQVADDAPLVFLGRLDKIKGCHTAIRIAKATGKKLVIAGNISNLPHEQAYFEQEIKPHLDGKQIHYVGTVNDWQKNELLGNAAALLMPIEWNEPFGIVMVEAMACGTPVIGFNRGAVPEVVTHGLNGYIAEKFEELCQYSNLYTTLSRKQVRLSVENKFSSEVIVNDYLDIYRKLIDC